MADKKTHFVVYVDGYGKEHDALVTAVNVREPNYVSLCYVDANAPEADNVRHLWDVPNRAVAQKETNPDLPQYDVNCWKDSYEPHAKLPEDHPAFDHPFKAAEQTETGQSIQRPRPKFAAAIHDHAATVRKMAEGTPATSTEPNLGFAAAPAPQEVVNAMTPEESELAAELERELNAPPVPIVGAGLPGPSAEDLDAVAAEQAAAEATSGAPVFETKQYADGSSATGVAPLPDLSPDEQAAKEADVTADLQAAADAGPAPEPPSDDTKPFND